MKIKSLLLGSAAALAMATGAQAADAIMAAQPEPVDYVRVCDAFGTGYFYIPGTETCLRIHGYMREQVAGGKLLANENDAGKYSTNFFTRFQLEMDTKSNTELGVLHTYAQLRFNYSNYAGTYNDENNGNGGDGVDIRFAYLELGGFRVGLTESEFSRLSFYGNGYAGGVINDTIVGYGPFAAQQISYTYKNNAFSAVLAVEDDNGGGHDYGGSSTPVFSVDPKTGAITSSSSPYPKTDYVPDVLGGLAYNNGTYGAAVIGAWDTSLDAGAVKARVDAKFGKVSAFLMGGWSSNGNETGTHGCTGNASITSCGSNRFAVWGGDWAVWGGLSADLTKKVSANLQLSYDDDQNFGAAGNLVFHVVPGFDVTTEVDYAKSGYSAANAARYKLTDNAWGGVVRFQRTF